MPPQGHFDTPNEWRFTAQSTHRRSTAVDPKRPFRLLAWISCLDQDLPGGRWSDLNDWSQVSGVMVADHRPARASAIVAATNAFFAFL